jgi:AcrR family transcriptional regulator
MDTPNMQARAGGKRERTRTALIEAAAAEIAQAGLAAASLDAIARRAGMTKGAIYSNFADKAELVTAVRRAKAPKLIPRLEAGAPYARQLELIAESLIEALPAYREQARLFAEYNTHALADADFGRRLAERYAAQFDRHADLLATCPDPPGDPRQVAVLIQTLCMGFVWQALLSPPDVSPQAIRKAFASLAAGEG